MSIDNKDDLETVENEAKSLGIESFGKFQKKAMKKAADIMSDIRSGKFDRFIEARRRQMEEPSIYTEKWKLLEQKSQDRIEITLENMKSIDITNMVKQILESVNYAIRYKDHCLKISVTDPKEYKQFRPRYVWKDIFEIKASLKDAEIMADNLGWERKKEDDEIVWQGSVDGSYGCKIAIGDIW